MVDNTGNKTAPTGESVDDFLDAVTLERRREDAKDVCAIMREVTGEPGTMWGPAIVGFGHYHYRYDSGREGDWFKVGFSPRKQSLTVYLMDGYGDRQEQLERLGPHKLGKSCLYITRLDKVDTDVLREMIADSFQRPHPAEI